jgi:hypothetical protein
MGVDTRAYYLNITREELFNFVKTVFDKNAKHELKPRINKDYSNIDFKYGGESRTMHVHRTDIDVERDMKKWKADEPTDVDSGVYVHQDGLPDKSKGIMVSLGMWGGSIEIVEILAMYFGGYIDERDTDSKPYYYIKKNLQKLIRSIL